MPNIAIIIVNWNGRKYLKDCFESLREQTYKNFKIFFVDNGSRDDSVAYIKNKYLDLGGPSVEIIELNKNTGFCYGNNIGIDKALKNDNIRYVITLNNDTKLHIKFIENIVECSKKFPDAGAVQPKVLNLSNPEEIDCAGIVLAKDGTAHNRGYRENKDKYNDEAEIFGANATASLFKREALEKTRISPKEYFDNDYFTYYEDTDLTWRMRLAGFRAYFCPKSVAYHLHSATSGKTSLLKAYYLHRNYFFTVFKNYPFAIMNRTLARRFASYFGLVFNVFKKEKREQEFVGEHRKGRVALVILKAWGSVIYNLPRIIARRREIRKIRKASKREINLWLKQYQADS